MDARLTDPALLLQAQGGAAGGALKAQPAGHAAAREVAEAFESIFLFEMLKSMSVGLDKGGPMSAGPREGMYRSMMNEEMAKAVTANGGIGIADAVYREIMRLQEVTP